MPKIISDDLFEDLTSNLREHRLLGVMGKLERLQVEAQEARVTDETWYEDGEGRAMTITTYESRGETKGETKTNCD